MANAHRGEIDFALQGEVRPLRLTLGGLAELEAAFGADGLAALGARLSAGRLSAADALAVLAAGFRGGGLPITAERLGELVPASAATDAALAAARLLAVTFGGGSASRPPPPQAA